MPYSVYGDLTVYVHDTILATQSPQQSLQYPAPQPLPVDALLAVPVNWRCGHKLDLACYASDKHGSDSCI
jgi:hypothetical protein